MNFSQKNILNKAVQTASLEKRLETNKKLASKDFDAWVSTILNSFEYQNILDVCCGTGNQVLKYASMHSVKKIVGIDIAAEAIKILHSKTNLDKRIKLIVGDMDQLSTYPVMQNKFDFISCFYGLYYSKNPKNLIKKLVERLYIGGHILVVGPYGRNNKSLFKLLERYFDIPKFVKDSSTIFMQDVVMAEYKKLGLDMEQRKFVNQIKYPDSQSLFNYWQSSTFYNPKFALLVKKDIDTYFENHNEFVVEKHIMACIGTKL